MRERGVSTLGSVLLAALAGLLTAAVLVDWVVVDVSVPEDSVHVKVPFPLFVGQMAASFIPDGALEDAELPSEISSCREQVLQGLTALLDAPDATLVKVESDDANVLIDKVGDQLRIAVDADDAVVRCNVPLDGVHAALADWDWQTADPGLLFDILAKADNGTILTVEADDGVRVAINMW